ncbi:MAG: ThuA domain-containing protein [Gemmatimonadaceae bacterium]
MLTRSSLVGLLAVAQTCILAPAAGAQLAPIPRLLVFSKTAGYRHSSIETGIAAIQKLGQEQGFAVDATEDAATFNDKNLKRYRAVVFLSTTGDVLNPTQEAVFERYIQAGGGYVGIHSATDTEYGWPWYGKLAGAYFNGHPGNPNVRRGTFRVVDKSDPSTQGLPDRWDREDEFYNFKSLQPDLHVLVDIDEHSYEGGTNGDRHPMSWYHAFSGGRAWYTNMGHTEGTFGEPLFLRHLLAGLRYAMGGAPLDYRRSRPEENRFTQVVLGSKLNEPIELAVLPDERVLFIERAGVIKLYSPLTKQIAQIGAIPVSMKYTNGDRAEDGLLGLAIDPGFASNGWVYLYYSPAGTEPKNVLARYTMHGDSIDLASGKIVLEVKVQRDQCCHTGGSIAFDGHGNLFLSTGDNTNPFGTGYAPIDERPGRSPWDAQKSSANTNDLRGKVIRIHPEPDASYTIPAGNLFPPGTPKTRPEIYTMGHRNPYRIFVDPHDGVLYWGDVGPDANVDSVGRGPAGQDEVGRAPRAGNYGWPLFVGDNKAYNHVDFNTMQGGAVFDPDHPVNDSPNNTGLTELPPAQKAFIWYPYGPSAEFPLVGNGGRTALAGPVIHRDDFRAAARAWPTYYDGKLLTYDWMRGWIMAVTMDSSGNFADMERFMPSTRFSNPTDMAFGPNGDLYLLEYGTTWFQGNDDARLSRIEFNAGNRAPKVVAKVDRPVGALPLRVKLSADGTTDADDDSLRYQWTVTRRDGSVVRRLTGASASLTLAQPGTYTATLAVTDAQGARSTAKVLVGAGNEPPIVSVDVVGSNRSFYFAGVPVHYAVKVNDREDGSLANGRVPAKKVRVTAAVVEDSPELGLGEIPMPHAEGKGLLEASDCLSCHKVSQKSIGPAYTAVAAKYTGDTSAALRLARKIRSGGTGVWGNVMMPAHAQLTEREASQVVAYILSLNDKPNEAAQLPVTGDYVPSDSATRTTDAAIVLQATYTDRGANGLLGTQSGATLVLRSPTMVIATGDLSEGTQKVKVDGVSDEVTLANRAGAYAKLSKIDLTGLAAVVVSGVAPAERHAVGGTVQVRLDSLTGPVAGETEMIRPTPDETPRPYRLSLQPTNGVHDLYLVFRNDQVTTPQMLFALLTATFESTEAAGRR